MTEDSFEKVTDFGNLYIAYKKARQGKGSKDSKARFGSVALDGIYQLKKMLDEKSYDVGKYTEFKVYDPKERVIQAGNFKDKIVQHSLCDNALIPLLKNEFIRTNYAGQVNKGTDYGLSCLQAQMCLAYFKYGYECWIIKADIGKFFYSIDHDILKDIVRYFVMDDDTYWLCEKFINSISGVGLPLGNQVSQVYALLYLSGLDHFITGELGVEYYGRYMDDFYLIVQSKEYAKWCLMCIREFVNSINLTLNGKTQIIPFKNGIKFCGFHTYVTSNGKVICKLDNKKKRKNLKKYRRMAKLVRESKLSKEKFLESYQSTKNHFSKGNCIKFTYEMDKMIKKILEETK